MPLCLLDNEHVSLSYTGAFPDKLKVKKYLRVWPLRLCYTATWDRKETGIAHKFSCKDTVFKGKFNIDHQALEYRKRFQLSGLGHALPGSLVIGAKWDFDEGTFKPRSIRPAFRVGVELLSGESHLQYRPPTGFSIRPNIFVTKALGFQVRAKAHVQLPSSLQFAIDDSGGQPSMLGGASVHFDVQELNLVLRI